MNNDIILFLLFLKKIKMSLEEEKNNDSIYEQRNRGWQLGCRC